MNVSTTPIDSLADLMDALAQREPRHLQLRTSILSPYSITLPPGSSLTGKDKDSCILSFSNGDGTIIVDKGMTTDGSVGNTLVKGVNMQLPAAAFSVKPGGVVDKLAVGGDLITHGADVTTYAVEGGRVNAIDVKGKILAHGRNSNAILVDHKGSPPLTNVRTSAMAGKNLVVADGEVTDRTGLSA